MQSQLEWIQKKFTKFKMKKEGSKKKRAIFEAEFSK